MDIKEVLKLLTTYHITTTSLTHYKIDDDYCLVFNNETMTGFEVSGDLDTQYHLEPWDTNSFYLDLAMKGAIEL